MSEAIYLTNISNSKARIDKIVPVKNMTKALLKWAREIRRLGLLFFLSILTHFLGWGAIQETHSLYNPACFILKILLDLHRK